MKRACRRAAELLQRRAAGLSTAAGLELEEHLHTCSDCREAANLLSGVRALYISHEPQLTPIQRESAIARAIAATTTLDLLDAGDEDREDAATMVFDGRGAGAQDATRIARAVTARRARTRMIVRRFAPMIWLVPPALAAAAVLTIMRGPGDPGSRTEQTAWGTGHTNPRESAGAPVTESGDGHTPPTIASARESAATSDDRHAPQVASAREPAATSDDRHAPQVASAREPAAASSDSHTPPSVSSTRESGASGTDRVLQGRVDVDGIELESKLALTAAQQVSSAQGATLALGHATAQLRPASRVRWDAEQEQLALIAGSVEVSVDPGPKRRFSVTTGRFTALVLGTVFEVSLDRVRVREGRVRVIDRSGGELAVLNANRRAVFELRSSSGPPSSAADPADLLERARQQISERQLPEARRSLSRVLSLAISREQRAEARTLQAECALVAGEYAAARDQYLSVAGDFPTLPAGQTALFAAARSEAEHGQPARANELFQRYLARYPKGRFAREAVTRLRDARPAEPKPATPANPNP